MKDFLNHVNKCGFYLKCSDMPLKGSKQKRSIVFEGNHSITSKLCLIIASVVGYLKG